MCSTEKGEEEVTSLRSAIVILGPTVDPIESGMSELSGPGWPARSLVSHVTKRKLVLCVRM